jgi:hypothetical protein
VHTDTNVDCSDRADTGVTPTFTPGQVLPTVLGQCGPIADDSAVKLVVVGDPVGLVDAVGNDVGVESGCGAPCRSQTQTSSVALMALHCLLSVPALMKMHRLPTPASANRPVHTIPASAHTVPQSMRAGAVSV